ncbi:MAG: NADP-dependent oxidoreductase [Chloroflexi bacterium]|nr:NADP-dependent oxidoreductase [Chloroflexota bacterium]MDA1148244.1 NADP-dependent oxidoreductase [Chloroflexota bacterium]
MTDLTNHQLRLRSRPTGGAGPEHFEATEEPARPPEDGEVLLETLYVSIDPAMRVWMNEDPGYVPPIGLGEVMRGGGIARVLESRAEGFAAGDVVAARPGWQDHPTLPAGDLQKLDLSLGSIEDWAGPIGTTGLTAFFGIREVGKIKPGETVLVSGAAGAVGQMVGQIAKIEGCTVVGIAGGPEKCARLTDELNFDAAIDYKATDDLEAAIASACPDGVDVFFDNVGGETLDAALANLRMHGRAVICGRISQTAAEELYGIKNLGLLIGKRARVEGFIVSDYASEFGEARRWISQRLREGELRQTLHVVDGLARAPEALAMLFAGKNTGKLVVRVAAED